MVKEVIYRCINTQCARQVPRAIAFCPYCGSAQQVKAAEPASTPAPTMPPAVVPQPAPQPTPAPTPPATPAPTLQPTPQPTIAPAPAPPPTPASNPVVSPTQGATIPPAKKPMRLRYWLLLIAVLFVIWQITKSSSKEQHTEKLADALRLSADCQLTKARAELSALKDDKASAEQIEELSMAIERAAPGCEKKRQREKSWQTAKTAIEKALQENSAAKASAALNTFIRRWGEDKTTQEQKDAIDLYQTRALVDMAETCIIREDLACAEQRLTGAERRKQPSLKLKIRNLREQLQQLKDAQAAAKATPAPTPMPVPTPTPIPTQAVQKAAPAANSGQGARKLINNAERDIALGNYKGAADKMDVCITIVDPGNEDCQQLKQRAERLNKNMLACVASGAEWVNERCQN